MQCALMAPFFRRAAYDEEDDELRTKQNNVCKLRVSPQLICAGQYPIVRGQDTE